MEALASLGALSLLLAGCGDSDSGPGAEAVALDDDLRAVFNDVAETRGIPPPAGIEAGAVPRADVRKLLEDTLTDEDRESFERLSTVYRLLGLIGPEDDYETLYLDFAANALIGFYDPGEDQLWLVDGPDGLPFASFDATLRSTVAHEFVHALQDSRFDLPAVLKRAAADPDWGLALSAVLEGDAVHHERLWAAEALAGSEVGNTTIRTTRGGGIPAALERELRFPYESGLDWAALAGAMNGNALTDAVLQGKRITTAEILHPHLTGQGWQPVDVAAPKLADDRRDDWEHLSGGSFGEFRLRNFLQLHLTGLPAVAGAEGWAGDRFDVYEGPGGQQLAVIRIAFASEQDRAEFVTTMEQWFTAAAATVTGEGSTTYAELPGGHALALYSRGNEVFLSAADDLATVKQSGGLLVFE